MGSQEARITADDLEAAVLEMIFVHACSVRGASGAAPAYRHRASIPQVCKRWAQLYAESTVLWRDVRLDWSVVRQQAAVDSTGVPDLAPFLAAAAWLAARIPVMQRLTLLGYAAQPGWDLSQAFPCGLRSPRLQHVEFLGALGTLSAELALLRGCTSVHTLAVTWPPQATGTDNLLCLRGNALARLSELPALHSLELHIIGSTCDLSAALVGLTRLSLRCRIESAALAPGFLEGLSQLRHLELGTVRLAQFSPLLARALGRLTHLACSDVLAAQPRRRAGIQLWQGLRHLPSLQELRLENQTGVGMPENALACSGLTRLSLVSCQLNTWPLSLQSHAASSGGCLGRLQALHLGSLRLVRPVPPLLWSLLAPGLTELTWHSITRQPGPAEVAEGEEGSLQQLMLAAVVPPELALLQRLRVLRLEYCQLDAIPPAVQALTQLTSLSLEGNRITSLPQGPYLSGLVRLSLANNACTEVPHGLSGCSSLRELSLADNPLLQIGREAAQLLVVSLPCLQHVHRRRPTCCYWAINSAPHLLRLTNVLLAPMAPRAASKKRKLEDSSVQERRGRAKDAVGAKPETDDAVQGNDPAAHRRTGRQRPAVDYAEPTMKQLLEQGERQAAAGAQSGSAGRGPAGEPAVAYDPPAAATVPVEPSFDESEGRRDRQGRLLFQDHPEFRPNLTPKQVIQAGSFGGIYFNPRGGKPGIRGKEVAIDHREFPADWFQGLPKKAYVARTYTKGTNKYGVKAGQDQAFWEGKGWIQPQDPRGWFQWYCRFYMGRRSEDDVRQISRWRGVVGDKGRWMRALANKVVRSNKRWDDATVSPVIRQTLLHWAFEMTEDEFGRMQRQL
ncbi:Volume-regulated anion channel subunit [Chlorella vulgaris]